MLQRPTVSTLISKENPSISTDGSFTNNATEGMKLHICLIYRHSPCIHESHVWRHRSVIKIGTLTAAAIRSLS